MRGVEIIPLTGIREVVPDDDLVAILAVADRLASAAALVMGEGAEGIPAVLVCGYPIAGEPRPAAVLTRPLGEDLVQ